jgi:hypothetical protein
MHFFQWTKQGSGPNSRQGLFRTADTSVLSTSDWVNKIHTASISSNSINTCETVRSATCCNVFMYFSFGFILRDCPFSSFESSSMKSYSSSVSSSRFKPCSASLASTVEDLKDLRKSSKAARDWVSRRVQSAQWESGTLLVFIVYRRRTREKIRHYAK